MDGASNKDNRYLNTNSIEAIKIKHRKWKIYKYCKTDKNFESYKVARKKVIPELRKCKYYFEKDLAMLTKMKTSSSGVISVQKKIPKLQLEI